MDPNVLITMIISVVFLSTIGIFGFIVARALGSASSVADKERAALLAVVQDALASAKASTADDAAKALSVAAYEREALKQQAADHEAWRETLVQDKNNQVPVEDLQDPRTVRLSTGEDMFVEIVDGKEVLRGANGERYDILAGGGI